MRKILTFAAAGALAMGTSALLAQAVDPDVVGPARRAAAGAAKVNGAPGVEQRIERREEQRDERRTERGNPNAAARNQARANDPDQWRFRWHGNQWWYWTPQDRWVFYRDNAWNDYNATTYRAPGYYYGPNYRGRYRTGYRGYYNYNAPGANPYSNRTRAGDFGANLGAGIGAAADGPAGANAGAAIGGAIDGAVGAGNAATNQGPNPNSAPLPQTVPVPAQPDSLLRPRDNPNP